jgi:hypothetical protein
LRVFLTGKTLMSIQEYCIIRDYAYCCHLLALTYEVRIGIFLFFGSFAAFHNFLFHPCFPRPCLPSFCLSFLHSPFHTCNTLSSSFLYSLSPVFYYLIHLPSSFPFSISFLFLFISSPTLSHYYPLLFLLS